MSKLSLGGKTASSKLSNWVQPSFGDLLGGPGVSYPFTKGSAAEDSKSKVWPSGVDVGHKRHRKRKGELQTSKPQLFSSRQGSQEHQDEPWVDVHSPQSKTELAVHRKKVEEIESWLRVHLDIKSAQKIGTILLLTGPPGCGKTATIHVLAKDVVFLIQEWSNPTTSEYRTDDSSRQSFDPDSRFNIFHRSSQTGAFQEFLLRANKYNRLQMSGDSQAQNRKIILVEEFPNQFYRQPGYLHDHLRRFVKNGKCPLVFIVSDSLSGDASSRLLFPKEIQQELGIHHISFNPVAPTSMMKTLSRIASTEASKSAGRVSVPDKEVLEQLCSGSSGDIRSAINSLHFSSFTDYSLEKSHFSKKGKLSAVKAPVRARGRIQSAKCADVLDVSPAIGGKDASLFLFRALGKILYCKRESYEGSEVPKLPAHLSVHQRDRLLVDPELVTERSHMSGEFFNLYLHQNYLEFFCDVEDVARASEYLSDADFLTAEWSAVMVQPWRDTVLLHFPPPNYQSLCELKQLLKIAVSDAVVMVLLCLQSRSTMLEYGSSVATRGLLHSNSARAHATSQSSVGFKPFHKPHWLQINKTYRENHLSAQSLFLHFCLAPISLVTELVPYLAKLSNPMRNQAQIAFIQDVGHLSLRRFPGRLKLEALGDKDPGGLDSESENEDGAQTTDPGTSSSSGATTVEPSLQNSQDPAGELPASQPQPSTSEALLDDDDLLIEEYDSD